jgi:hypothetical protein
MKLIPCALLVLVALSLTGCPPKDPNNKKPGKKPPLMESSEIDFQSFVGILRKAVKARDLVTLSQMMASDFGYRMKTETEPEGSGSGAFQYWDQNNLWPELEGILSERFVKKGNFMVAPPQFADDTSGYDGYRAGIIRINGSWKFAYFVNGSPSATDE